jgi:hypothetical protein
MSTVHYLIIVIVGRVVACLNHVLSQLSFLLVWLFHWPFFNSSGFGHVFRFLVLVSPQL